MASTCIRVMVVILCLYLHMSMNGATPFTRSSNLVKKIKRDQYQVEEGALLENPNLVVRRMEIEVNDYPGSGANNRHTPRPQMNRN
ncbi:hypothetical protein SASPL_149529 [Salvia splendens]|uniref:Uncharacterized protein n=1 Tax=Salvia splendens TaxID=180675 RepID=A0A8X8Z5B2_SALSN|nr:hypothetical protein SASPL_149529 [Salvia splendens]